MRERRPWPPHGVSVCVICGRRWVDFLGDESSVACYKCGRRSEVRWTASWDVKDGALVTWDEVEQ